MLSYLDYDKNDEDDKCLVNIFGRYSSSDEEADDHEKKRNGEEKGEDREKIVDEVEEIPQTSLTTYQFKNQTASLEIETNRIKGIAHQLWPASYLLCDYLETHLKNIFKDSSENVDIIELGAGVGLSGIALGILLEGRCRRVIITDLPEAQELITKNIQRNIHLFPSQTRITSEILRWGVPDDYQCYRGGSRVDDVSTVTDGNLKRSPIGPPPPQQQQLYVIAADCVYWEHLYEPFYQTLHHFISTYDAVVLLAHYKRWKKEKKFFALCSKNFQVEVIYENIDMVPITDEHLDASYLPTSFNTNEHAAEDSAVTADGTGGVRGKHQIPMRKQISRIYSMKRK
jgi:protein N-lysine methyltransferase METTL21C